MPKVFQHVPYAVVVATNPEPYEDAQPGDLLVTSKCKASIWPGIPVNSAEYNDDRSGDCFYIGPYVIPLDVTRHIADFDAAYGASNIPFTQLEMEIRLDTCRPDVKKHLKLNLRGLLAALDVDMLHPRVLAVLGGKQSDYIYIVAEIPEHEEEDDMIKYNYSLCLDDEDGLTVASLAVKAEGTWKIHRESTLCTILCDKTIDNPSQLSAPDYWDSYETAKGKSYMVFGGDYAKIDRQLAYLRMIQATNIRVLQPDHEIIEGKKKRYIGWSENAKARWYYKWKKIVEMSIVAYDLGLPPYVVLEIVDWLPGMWAHNHKKKITLIQSVWNAVRRLREKRNSDAEAKRCIKD